MTVQQWQNRRRHRHCWRVASIKSELNSLFLRVIATVTVTGADATPPTIAGAAAADIVVATKSDSVKRIYTGKFYDMIAEEL